MAWGDGLPPSVGAGSSLLGAVAVGEGAPPSGGAARSWRPPDSTSVPIMTAVAATAVPAATSTAGKPRLRRAGAEAVAVEVRAVGSSVAELKVLDEGPECWRARGIRGSEVPAEAGKRSIRSMGSGSTGSGSIGSGSGPSGGLPGPYALYVPVPVSALCTAASTPGKSSR
ncbi:hypothetical protein PQR15_25460 [Streptomyces lydicus]|nr:hypothetical protein [Streptomyces lydicus]